MADGILEGIGSALEGIGDAYNQALRTLQPGLAQQADIRGEKMDMLRREEQREVFKQQLNQLKSRGIDENGQLNESGIILANEMAKNPVVNEFLGNVNSIATGQQGPRDVRGEIAGIAVPENTNILKDIKAKQNILKDLVSDESPSIAIDEKNQPLVDKLLDEIATGIGAERLPEEEEEEKKGIWSRLFGGGSGEGLTASQESEAVFDTVGGPMNFSENIATTNNAPSQETAPESKGERVSIQDSVCILKGAGIGSPDVIKNKLPKTVRQLPSMTSEQQKEVIQVIKKFQDDPRLTDELILRNL